MKVLIQTSIYYKEKVTFKRNYESMSTMVNIYLNTCLKSLKIEFNDVYKMLDLYFDAAT